MFHQLSKTISLSIKSLTDDSSSKLHPSPYAPATTTTTSTVVGVGRTAPSTTVNKASSSSSTYGRLHSSHHGSNNNKSKKAADATEEQYIHEHINIFNQFTDLSMIPEYTEFCGRQRSLMLMFGLNIFFTGSLICAIASTAQLPANHPKYLWVMSLLTAGWVIDFVEVVLVWVIFYSQLVTGPTVSPIMKFIRAHSHHIQYAVLACITLGYVCRLFGRVISGECYGQETLLFTSWNCNYYAHNGGLPMDTAFALMLTPILFINVARELRVEYVITSFAMACCALLGCIWLVQSVQPFSYVGPYVVLGFLIIVNATRQNLICFLLYRKLKATLEENELMAAEVRANELRHMIRNVAHDLKTPLSSFMTGIDVISQVIDDYEVASDSSNTLQEAKQDNIQFVSTLKECIEDVRNTNTFMLMAINRCMDYTRASVGLQLIPKHESIPFRESLQLPLECMKNIQEKIRIILSPIPPNIAFDIITDLQWLQENLLCYLSNAVKFANSEVVVTISLKAADQIRDGVEYARKQSTGSISVTSAGTSFSRDSNAFSSSHIGRSPSYDSDNDSISMSLSSGFLDHAAESDITKWFRMKEQERAKFEKFEHVIVIEVEDDGVGISDSTMTVLFDPVRQAQRLAAGLGLGLYSLSKRVEALKGFYGVSKRRANKQGSKFWFAFPYRPDYSKPHHLKRLPKAKPTAVKFKDKPKKSGRVSFNAATVVPMENSNDEDDHNHSPGPNIAELDFQPSSASITSSIKTVPSDPILRILLVEDSPTVAKATALMFTRQGHKVTLVNRCEEALQLIQSEWHNDESKSNPAYDVVLMDVQMSAAEGLTTVAQIRELEATHKNKYFTKIDKYASTCPHQKIVGMMIDKEDTTSSTGCDAMLIKPFSYQTFLETYKQIERESIAGTLHSL